MRDRLGKDPVKRPWRLAALAAAAATPCSAATPLETCIRAQTAAAKGATDALVQLDHVRMVCNNIATDQARLNILIANGKIYANQLTMNNVLLFVVVIITLCGLVLSALQLWASYKLALTGHGTLADGGDVNITTSNVAVKSSVVGVVILGVSLAFFTLFIIYVYPLKPLAASPPSVVPAVGPPAAGGSAAAVQPPPPPGLSEAPR